MHRCSWDFEVSAVYLSWNKLCCVCLLEGAKRGNGKAEQACQGVWCNLNVCAKPCAGAEHNFILLSNTAAYVSHFLPCWKPVSSKCAFLVASCWCKGSGSASRGRDGTARGRGVRQHHFTTHSTFLSENGKPLLIVSLWEATFSSLLSSAIGEVTACVGRQGTDFSRCFWHRHPMPSLKIQLFSSALEQRWC